MVGAGAACPSSTADCNPRFALARYDPDGSLDPTFGDGGKQLLGGCAGTVGAGMSANAVAIDPAGRIVLAGSCSVSTFALARYNSDGSLDPTFGSGGFVTTQFAGGSGAGDAFSIAIDPSGRIVAAGFAFPPFALARYTPAGALDPTFGSGGLVTTLRPTTTIAKAKIRARKRTATFTFQATGPSTGLQCAFRPSRSRQPKFRTCRSPKTYRR